MEIVLKRVAKKPTYTIGKLSIDGEYICDTIEDMDRGLSKDQPLSQIKNNKKYGLTAIPTGKYEILMNVVSPKYSNSAFYKTYANGSRVPRLKDVPGWEGVLIHTGNTAEDSLGCIIVGYNKVIGKVINSKEAFKDLYSRLLKAKDKIYITIK